MDVKMINPFINATLNVLETMAFVKSEAEKPYLKKNHVAQGDVSGVVGFTGDTNGTLAVTFDELCILKIVSNMFGEEMTEVNDEIADAVGELTNMISDPLPSQEFDVISCRNVLIYFDNIVKTDVINKLYNALKWEGYFIIGGAESLSNIKHGYTYIEPSIYMKVR